MTRDVARTMPHHIQVDEVGYDFPSMIQNQFESKIYNPTTDPFAYGKLKQQLETWKNNGCVSVFTTGVFDMLHLDHSGYLIHTRTIGSIALYEKQNPESSWEDLRPLEKKDYFVYALGSNLIKQIVSVDGDKTVADRKGFNPAKGNVPRPIYAWSTRARMVAGLSYMKPASTDGSGLLPTVDAVTLHGHKDVEHIEDPNHNHFNLALALQPNVWVCSGESEDILDTAPKLAELNSRLVCIPVGPGTHYYTDPVIGKMSTTSVVSRIKGYN